VSRSAAIRNTLRDSASRSRISMRFWDTCIAIVAIISIIAVHELHRTLNNAAGRRTRREAKACAGSAEGHRGMVFVQCGNLLYCAVSARRTAPRRNRHSASNR
jgi:hypothetical protein